MLEPQLCAIPPEYALLGLSYVTNPHNVRATCVLSGLRKLGWGKTSYSRPINGLACVTPHLPNL